MANQQSSRLYQCQCFDCINHASGTIAQEHLLINRLVAMLDEKQRRRFVSLLAYQQGYGGIQALADITRLHRNTIARGLRETQADAMDDGRIRQTGGGRKPVEKKNRGFFPI